MSNFFNFIVKYSKTSIAFILLPSLFFLTKLPEVKIDTSFERLSIKNDEQRAFYNKTIKEFGHDDDAIIFIEDKDLYTPKKLLLIKELVSQLEEIEEVTTINSLFTSFHIKNKNEELDTAPVFEEIPNTQENINQKVEEALASPLLNGYLINPNKNSMLIFVQYIKDKRSLPEIRNEINTLLSPLKEDFSELIQSGKPEFDDFILNEIMLKEQKILLPVLFLLIGLFIFLGTKSFSAAIIPIITSIFTVIWTLGLMSLLDIPIGIMTSLVPTITYILGSTETTHLMTEFLQSRQNKNSFYHALELTGHHVGLAVLLTALTTSIGFYSLCFNEITMLREFGIISGSAIIFNLIISLIYFPLHLNFFNQKEIIKRNKKKEKPLISNEKINHIFQVYLFKKKFHLLTFILLSFCLFMSVRVKTDNDSLAMLSKSSTFRLGYDKIGESFPGLNAIYIIFESKEKNAFKKSQNLSHIFNIQQWIQQNSKFSSAQSYASVIALFNREIIAKGPEEFKIPSNDNLIAQYDLSLSRSDIEQLISADGRRVNLIFRHKISSSEKLKAALAKLDHYLQKNPGPKGISYQYTSQNILNLNAASTIVRSQAFGLSIMIGCIFLVVSFLFSSVKMGLLAIPTNLFPIIIFFGILGLFNIPLDLGTCMVAAVTIGIAIDDTIHFFLRYSNKLKKYEDPMLAAAKTLSEESRPIITTSLSLSIGFLSLVHSDFLPVANFGWLSAVIILVAMFSDLIFTPTTLILFKVAHLMPRENFLFSQLKQKTIDHGIVFNGLDRSEIKILINMGEVLFIQENSSIKLPTKESTHYVIIDGLISIRQKERRSSEKDQESSDVPIGLLEQGEIIHSNRTQNSSTSLHAEQSCKILIIDPTYLNRLNRFSSRIYSKFCDNINTIN